MIAKTFNIPKITVHNIISNNLNVQKVCAKLVPKLLTDDDKNNRVIIAIKLLERVQNKPDFSNNAIGDET